MWTCSNFSFKIQLFATPKLHDEDVFAIIPIPQQERERMQKGVEQVSFLQHCASIGEGWDKSLSVTKKVQILTSKAYHSNCCDTGNQHIDGSYHFVQHEW